MTTRGGQEVAALWVERTCMEQGLPARVREPAVLAKVVALLGLQPPDGDESSRVKPVAALHGSLDGQGVEDSRHDGVLPGQGQVRPSGTKGIGVAHIGRQRGPTVGVG